MIAGINHGLFTAHVLFSGTQNGGGVPCGFPLRPNAKKGSPPKKATVSRPSSLPMNTSKQGCAGAVIMFYVTLASHEW